MRPSTETRLPPYAAGHDPRIAAFLRAARAVPPVEKGIGTVSLLLVINGSSVREDHELVGGLQKGFARKSFVISPLGRGFQPGRFVGDIAVIGQLEYRFPVWTIIDGVPLPVGERGPALQHVFPENAPHRIRLLKQGAVGRLLEGVETL